MLPVILYREGIDPLALHRIFVLLLALSLLLILLAGRLLWLQTAETAGGFDEGANVTQRSVKQRRTSVVLDSGRGRIVDRRGIPLAGIGTEALLVMPAGEEKGEEGVSGAGKDGDGKSGAGDGRDAVLAARMADILGIPARQAADLLAASRNPLLWRKAGEAEPVALSAEQAEALRRLGSERLLVVPYVRRYRPAPLAAHLIGYLSEHPERMERLYARELSEGRLGRSDALGASGLERAFDRFLHGSGKTVFSIYRDGTDGRLAGLGNRLQVPENPYFPLTAVMTLDAALQERVEEMMDALGLEDAAIVVLDAEQADVRAMAVRPAFDPYRVSPEDGLWQNRAVMAEIPGSVFKTVVAAAALEHGAVRRGEKFDCSGGRTVYGIRCWKPGGHGILTLEQAFAQSCNTAFAEIAARLTPGQLEKTARALGLLQPIGWQGEAVPGLFGDPAPLRQFDGEQAGSLFAAGAGAALADKGMMAQTGIGQRDVRISPLQAATMAAAIANGGKVYEPRAVSEIRYANNRSKLRFASRRRPVPELSPGTIRWLQGAMRLAVTEGTAGRLAGVEEGVAGKTGTAETGVSGGGLEHHWFIGYTPVRHPQYAFAIVVRNVKGEDGGHRALAVAERLIPLLARQQQKAPAERKA